VMRNSPRLGFLTSISVDNSNNWVIVGSDLGIYTIWDLRFQIPVRSFSHPSDSPCVSLAPAPRYSVFGSNQDSTVTLWDVESGVARNILRITKPRPKGELQPLQPIQNLAGFQHLKLVSSEG
jgi:phosphoinositide-3-kinase regulatory subunit 4